MSDGRLCIFQLLFELDKSVKEEPFSIEKIKGTTMLVKNVPCPPYKDPEACISLKCW